MQEGFKPPRDVDSSMAGTVLKASPAPSSETMEACDVCGAPTYEIRCKVICKQCGYTRDCSDP